MARYANSARAATRSDAIVIGAAGAAMAVGSVLPWARSALISLPGTEVDGVFTLIAGGLVVFLAVAARDRPSRILRVGVLLLFAFGLWVAWNTFSNVSDQSPGELFGTEIGNGVVVTAGAAALGLVFSLLWLSRSITTTSPPATDT